MLNTLYQLAQEEKLISNPSLEMKPVAWTVVLNQDGTLAGTDFISNKQLAPPQLTPAGKEKKRREITQRMLIPRQFVIETGAGRTSGAYAYFLVDKADYVFGLPPGSPAHTPQTDEKAQIKHDLFIQNIADCQTATQSKTLEAVLKFLRIVREKGLPILLPETVASNDQFAFKVLPKIEQFVHDLPDIVAYWEKLANPKPSADAEVKLCLVTGKPFTHNALFPMVKGIPGPGRAGTGLVSFNKKSFDSYGWDGGENAPISPYASQSIATALNRLMDPAFETQEGRKLPKRHEHIAKDTAIAYWPKGFWISKLDEHEGSFSNLLASSWKGIKPHPDDASPFHAFTLTGLKGRIIVRDHFETTANKLYDNLKFHYDSLQIEPLTYPAKGKELPPLYGTRSLLETTVLDGKTDNISPPLAVQFYQAIHKGERHKFPESLIHKALERSRSEIHDDSWKASFRADIRAALLKAYLIRNHDYKNIYKSMNPEETRTAYLFGRIFSCYGEMQRLANLPRTVNSDLTTKFYSKFFARPLATYSALGSGYNRHYKTALKNKGAQVAGLAIRLNNEVEIITRTLRIGENTTSFSTKEQAFFTLGFHHQNHWNRRKNEDRVAWLQSLNLDPYSDNLLIAPLKKLQPITN